MLLTVEWSLKLKHLGRTFNHRAVKNRLDNVTLPRAHFNNVKVMCIYRECGDNVITQQL